MIRIYNEQYDHWWDHLFFFFLPIAFKPHIHILDKVKEITLKFKHHKLIFFFLWVMHKKYSTDVGCNLDMTIDWSKEEVIFCQLEIFNSSRLFTYSLKRTFLNNFRTNHFTTDNRIQVGISTKYKRWQKELWLIWNDCQTKNKLFFYYEIWNQTFFHIFNGFFKKKMKRRK